MPDTKNGDWTHYTADMRGATYSPLDQTTAGNVSIGQRYALLLIRKRAH